MGEPRPPAIGIGDLARDDGRGEGRIGVSVDEDAVRLALEYHRLEATEHLTGHRAVRAAADLQVDVRAGHLEVAEEGRAHGVVVVLAGVDEDLLVVAAEDAADRRGLDELRPRADDGEDPHLSPRGGGNASPQRGHRPWNVSPSTSRSGWPQGQALPRRRAGLPATSS